jgi:raffinose/stachyose/melibiose transport system substrate-binding protein
MRQPLLRRRALVAAGVASALAVAAAGCGSGGGGGNADITWWHIQNEDPMRSTWAAMADEWAEESGLSFDIHDIENEAFKQRMSTAAQSGDMPDLFQTWGGGVLAEQVEAGLVREMELDACIDKVNPAVLDAYTVNGKLYGLPFDAGVVGFWYNKDLFAQAGVDAPPETWSEFLDTVDALKAADITPIALAGADRWPGHFYWTYLVMRIVGLDELQAAGDRGDFSGDGFVRAGELLQELAEKEPFQAGFEGAQYGEPDGQAAHMGEGVTAMELMGQWAPTVQRDASGTDGPGDALGFFPFPAVEGGAGAGTEFLGGGNGFAVGSNAPDEIFDFLCYLLEEDNQARVVQDGNVNTVSSDPDSIDAEIDPHAQLVLDEMGRATATQLYLDQAFPPVVGETINEATEGLLLGQVSPEEFVERVNDAWSTVQ